MTTRTDGTPVDLLSRIDALEAQLKAQADEIERLKGRTVAASVPREDPGAHEATAERSGEEHGVSRREWLMKGAAGVAATALAATDAMAQTRTTVLAGAGSVPNYGLLAVSSGSSPAEPTTFLPALGGSFFGVIGLITGAAPTPPSSAGVWGAAFSSDGVQGYTMNGNGVRGRSSNGNGVRGEILGTSTGNAIAMYGLNSSTYTGPGPGAGGFGVYGLSLNGHGLVGATAAAGAAAVVGATNGVAGAYAGAFYGSVVIGGDLIVVGGAKSAAVPFADGSHRQLYCVESPESWFEDFGQGKLIDGCAEVAIEPGFGAVADMSEYLVFLTSYAEDLHLHVSKRTPTGFTVETDAGLAALKGRARADLGGAFGWRVVARRKDIAGERLAVVHMPPEPTLPPIDEAPPVAGPDEDAPGAKRRTSRP